MDHWRPMETNGTNMSMEEMWNRRFSPTVCNHCGNLHDTGMCPNPRENRYWEDEPNMPMQEQYAHRQFPQEWCELCGGTHYTRECSMGYQQHMPWRDNMDYFNCNDPHVYEENSYGPPPYYPDIHNQFEANEEVVSREEFEELKEGIKRVEATLMQYLKMKSQPQELKCEGEECSKESMSTKHYEGEVEPIISDAFLPVERLDEEEEFEEEIEEEEDLEVEEWVDSILPLDESTPDVLFEEEPLVELIEQEKARIEVDFVVEFLPQWYLKMKRQRDVEFALKIQDKGRINDNSRKEESTSERSKPQKKNRAYRESSTCKLGKEPGTVEEHDPDNMSFDPGDEDAMSRTLQALHGE